MNQVVPRPTAARDAGLFSEWPTKKKEIILSKSCRTWMQALGMTRENKGFTLERKLGGESEGDSELSASIFIILKINEL